MGGSGNRRNDRMMRVHRNEWLEGSLPVLLAAILAAACDSANEPSFHPGGLRDAAGASSEPSPAQAQAEAAADSSLDGSELDGSVSGDGPSDSDMDALPVPAPVRCDPDASAADVDANVYPCPLPPSVCVQGPSPTAAASLVYYSDGKCISGACTWVSHTIRCGVECVGGACIASVTAPL